MRSKANETEHLRNRAWCHRRKRQSDWETKIFSLVVSGENYGWAVEQPARNREKAE